MRIKRSLLNPSDSALVWNKLTEEHFISYTRTEVRADPVWTVFFLLADMHTHYMRGGLICFIDNEPGDFFHETLGAAKTIGCNSLTRLLEEIAGIFPHAVVPSNRKQRKITMDKIAAAWLLDNASSKTHASLSSLWDKWDHHFEALQGSLFSRTRYYLLQNAEFERN